jgi:hypothetical protein
VADHPRIGDQGGVSHEPGEIGCSQRIIFAELHQHADPPHPVRFLRTRRERVPFLIRGTCRTAPLKSTSSQRRVADLGRPQPAPVGQQDHGGVAVTGAVALGRLDQRLDRTHAVHKKFEVLGASLTEWYTEVQSSALP